jgi:D-alanine--poly(phosphoribitol) ligase subunit 1
MNKEWLNDGKVGDHMQIGVLEYFENTLKQHKAKVAVMDGMKKLTFGELERCAKRLSGSIYTKYDIMRRPVTVFLPKSVDCIVAFLSILYSGNMYAPLDIKAPHGKLKSILENLENPLVITSVEYIDTLMSIGVDPGNIIQINDAYDETANFDNALVLARYGTLIDTDPAYIIHTSGSTGVPKGVVIPHRGIIDYTDWAVECFDISSKEIIGNQAPFTFDNSTLDIYLSFATGATLVLIPEQLFAFPVKLMQYVAEKKINFIFWVPSVMINVANTMALEEIDLPEMQKVLFAGEVMPNKHLNYWRRKLPGRVFANLYGPTEITVDCTYYVVGRKFEDTEKLPIGFPCRNSDILILNQDDQPARINELGELCVRGSSLALGYWNNWEKSNEVFVQNPLNKHYFDRIYRTGDLVYLNELGEIIYSNRKDSQIKHMGYRIELGEIETAVLSIPGIENACVLYNKGRKELTLFYEGSDDLDSKKIRLQLIPLLQKYMIPTKIYKIECLPLNDNGKIDRKRIAMEWLERENA